jgi:glycine/D-amino acid oxidase-like deaminating enzyme
MRVLVVDAYGPGNSRATSGDETRGVRTSYGDRSGAQGEQWMRWANEAVARWRAWDEEWQKQFRTQLFYTTGDIILRKELESFTKRTKELWDKVGIRYDVLPVTEVNKRWPIVDTTDIGVVLYEPQAGVVRARRACEEVAEVFKLRGGEVKIAHAWLGSENAGKLNHIVLSTNETVSAGQYVFACGPWLPKLFPDLLGRAIRTPLGHVFYFATPPADDRFTYPNCPSWNYPGVTGWAALLPDNRGFRVRTGGDRVYDPDYSTRWVQERSLKAARQFVAQRFPLLAKAPINETRACHYELSASRNFIIDKHPTLSNVWIAGGGSAEGFKFGPVIGDFIAKRVHGDSVDPVLAEEFKIPKVVDATTRRA